MKWGFTKNETQQLMSEWDRLVAGVEQAKKDWQAAQQLLNFSEATDEIDDSIYYLRLTEIRYMYLMEQARLFRAS